MAFPETTVLAASPLESGDVAVWGGPSRLAYDGVDRLADGRLNFEIGNGPRPAIARRRRKLDLVRHGDDAAKESIQFVTRQSFQPRPTLKTEFPTSTHPEVRGEGWKWVEIQPIAQYPDPTKFDRLRTVYVPITDEICLEVEALQAEQEQIEDAHQDAEEYPPALLK